jgi:putative DNA primase/helicase
MTSASVKMMTDYALPYADLGWHVVPVHTVDDEGRCSCRNHECGAAGKHPHTAHGLKDATADPETIRRWWEQWPDANIGIACRPSRFVAIDIDERHGGYERFQALEDEFGALPPTIEAQTGGGGSHLLFQDPGGQIQGSLGPGVDVRSNAYIVVSPSLHQSGAHYQWVPGNGPAEIALAALPAAWVELVRKSSSPREGSGAGADGRISDGTRNKSLTSIGGSLRRHGLDGNEIAEVLVPINERLCDPPLDQDDVETLAVGMERYGPAPGRFPLTDTGNAERLVARHGHQLRCVAGDWYVWDHERWVRDTTGAAIRLTIDTMRAIPSEGATLDDVSKIGELLKFALKCESKAKIEAASVLAKNLAPVVMTFDQLDADPMLLNVANGTLDLRTGELREHSREDYITKLAPVRFDQQAECPIWLTYLDQVFGGNRDLIDYIQRALGYSMTGLTAEQCFFINYGSGANGKTTYAETVRSLFGDYAAYADASTILRHGADKIRDDLARLPGARVVQIMELEDRARLDDRLLKNITGGDAMTVRELYGKIFEFTPQCKLWLGTNHKPDMGDAASLWRRVRFIPFEVTIPENEQDPGLPLKLRQELSGILNFALEGCLRWQSEGLGMTPKVAHATAEYRSEEDQIGRFIEDCCVLSQDGWRPTSELYAAYSKWCGSQGEGLLEREPFGRKLGERPGLRSGRASGQRGWHGIGLASMT